MSWDDHARCLDADPGAFFVEKGESVEAAKALCRRCPVDEECLEFAMENDELFGVWGGTTGRERQRLKRQRRKAS